MNKRGIIGGIYVIYVTGDMHGEISRFASKALKRLRRKDTLIVCGDFGFLWDGSKQEKKVLKWIGRRRYNVLFIDGAHDNLTLLQQYPVTGWNGGLVREISGKLRYLCRGSVFQIEGKTIFAFGGGEIPNAMVDWCEKQLPGEAELQQAEKNLKNYNYEIDYIVTHQPGRKIKSLMSPGNHEANVLDVFLEEVRGMCRYTGWYFGAYHQDKVIPPRDMAVFESVIPLRGEFDLEPFSARKKKKI